jgi:hypothetical protein
MRNLSPTLLAAQQAASHVPFVKVAAGNRINGLVRLEWERLYTGSEENYYHALAVCGDGSLVRVRITPPADGRKLYRQTVTNPGPASNFSSWTYTNQYNCIAVAAAARGGVVSIFWINTSREIRRIVSTDNGANWGSPELIDHSPTTAVNGLAAAYKTNGDLALFFADQSTLYVKKCIGGTWQNKLAWDKTTGDLTGIAVTYDGDWDLLVTGTETSGDLKLWSLVYGDGGCFSAGNWSGLSVIASGPSDGLFQYIFPFFYKTNVFHCFFIENFSGNQSYSRVFGSHTIPDTEYKDSLWSEPVPDDISAPFGLAVGQSLPGDCSWLSTPNGVWKAALTPRVIDVTGDLHSVKLAAGERQGKLKVELRNDDGRYSVLPAPLQIGCQLDFSPGYLTPSGQETSDGPAFYLQSIEHYYKEGHHSVVLEACDGWGQLKNWQAHDQFRWNRTGQEKSVRGILEFVLARAGLELKTRTESAFISGYYPDFTIHPGEAGDVLVDRLLSLTSDILFFEGGTTYLVDPRSTDVPCYSYGITHAVLEGRYADRAEESNWVRLEGYDPGSGESIITDIFNWPKVKANGARHDLIEDINLSSLSQLQERGAAFFRKVDMASTAGEMTVPVNCGQQLYDVIDITGPGGVIRTRRVSGLSLFFEPARGRYLQIITLTGV